MDEGPVVTFGAVRCLAEAFDGEELSDDRLRFCLCAVLGSIPVTVREMNVLWLLMNGTFVVLETSMPVADSLDRAPATETEGATEGDIGRASIRHVLRPPDGVLGAAAAAAAAVRWSSLVSRRAAEAESFEGDRSEKSSAIGEATLAADSFPV